MPEKILMVCLGNICRSPLAEGILKDKVSPEEAIVDSAGTAGYHIGNPPDPRSVSIARQFGIDISSQRCRQFTPDDFIEFDRIYVMDSQNLADVAGQARNDRELRKVQLLLPSEKDIPDPYYGGSDGFLKVFKMIDAACANIAGEIKSENG